MWFSNFVQSIIHVWLNVTGKTVDFDRFPFLKGPMSDSVIIGQGYYESLAEKEGLDLTKPATGGLLTDFDKVIDAKDPNYSNLFPARSEFYEQTAKYKMEVWPKWNAPVSWFAKALIKLLSGNMQQLNIPMNAMETSYGMGSEVIHLSDTEGVKYACWFRKSIQSGKVVYPGFYSSCAIDGLGGPEHVRVVFPLPQGNVTVILKVEIQGDGSVKLVSYGRKFGGSGYYRLHRNSKGVVKSRMMPIKELIHVFPDNEGILRTDHFFKFLGLAFLQLHYKMMPKPIS
jgi:hypothetical protein